MILCISALFFLFLIFFTLCECQIFVTHIPLLIIIIVGAIVILILITILVPFLRFSTFSAVLVIFGDWISFIKLVKIDFLIVKFVVIVIIIH